ncbi:E3 ubiquitin-protein ligase SIAH1 [Cryptotermes secundus]|uniref:E3 ubiquitin-protein ligase n=2 Tax=Cryptotermes secundus TaxID=105785 RepID=A0A2J7REU2_9NEOP|nr:E3 ubiquitin-protein ligase SIAH1 [Cryptotermes secundus]
MATVQEDLASEFECPVCCNYLEAPVLQCRNGHVICANCRAKLTSCPICRARLGNFRNLAMEKVASTLMLPCNYSVFGCAVALLHTERRAHEEACEFQPYSCPSRLASCKWEGSLEQVMTHLMKSHKSIATLQGEDVVFQATDINQPRTRKWVMIQSCYGHHFRLLLEKRVKWDGHQHLYAIVQLIGTRKQAERFSYNLKLNGQRRRLTWEGKLSSMHQLIPLEIRNSDCLVFDPCTTQLFADKGNLSIHVSIRMV